MYSKQKTRSIWKETLDGKGGDHPNDKTEPTELHNIVTYLMKTSKGSGLI